jgi:large-conductance mechanosensitive channel
MTILTHLAALAIGLLIGVAWPKIIQKLNGDNI